MNIVHDVLRDHPTDMAEEFEKQFSDWSVVNKFGNIDPIELKLKDYNSGSDRYVYITKHPQILLKSMFGPQDVSIPSKFENLFVPFYGFEFPVPLQDPLYEEEGRPFGQFQLKVEVPYIFGTDFMQTRALQREVQSVGCDVNFAKAVIKEYGLDFFTDFISTIKLEEYFRLMPSRGNWGYLDGKPVIFDYGVIIE